MALVSESPNPSSTAAPTMALVPESANPSATAAPTMALVSESANPSATAAPTMALVSATSPSATAAPTSTLASESSPSEARTKYDFAPKLISLYSVVSGQAPVTPAPKLKHKPSFTPTPPPLGPGMQLQRVCNRSFRDVQGLFLLFRSYAF